MTIPLGRLSLIASRDLPEWQCGNAFVSYLNAPLLFGLAPDGVYHARHITAPAVRSYRTLSPLPVTNEGGLLSAALSLGSPPPGITRHRVSVEPGLSSSHEPKGLASDHPTI